ncbi:hypothetical protein [Halorussus sp. MSC15.2]|uniref:hypothetical protein n=1 Tax=Halorussus sp. MSC15.2 TaxID=2283638 RepID=UPI0013D49972|nr:hypothetical protein [Halorussus sp. MSC15.2]NEU56265.1 hypothetical protein [Halorussus sp. MSC15.2]
MKASKMSIAALLVILVASSAGAGVVGADTGSTTSTPTHNTTTTQTPTTTTTDVSTTNQQSSTTTQTTTTTTTESIEEQVREGVEDATGDNSPETSQSKTGNRDCVEVVTKSGNTTTKQCVSSWHYQIDNSTTIVAADWEGPVVTLVIESDRPQRVSVVDTHSIKSTGAGDVRYVERTLRSGKNVVKIRANEKSGDKTLTIGTSNDLDYISDPEAPFLSNGIRTELLYVTGAGGATSVLLVAFLFWKYKRRKLSKGWTNVFEDYSP